MNPDELYALLRIANGSKVKQYLHFVHRMDHSFYEKLINMFTECRGHDPSTIKPIEPATDP